MWPYKLCYKFKHNVSHFHHLTLNKLLNSGGLPPWQGCCSPRENYQSNAESNTEPGLAALCFTAPFLEEILALLHIYYIARIHLGSGM